MDADKCETLKTSWNDALMLMAPGYIHQLRRDCLGCLGRGLDAADDVPHCNNTFDSLVCWPATRAGHMTSQLCPPIAAGSKGENVTKLCMSNGTWDLADYSPCANPPGDHILDSMLGDYDPVTQHITFVCNIITTIALVVALAILLKFRSLRCLRNVIHCHFITAFICKQVLHLMLHGGVFQLMHLDESMNLCKLVFFLFKYFVTTTYFWMFIEGLYLVTIIVWAFSTQKIQIWHYAFIGWGIPFVILVFWAVMKLVMDDHGCWASLNGPSNIDWILDAPVIFLLLCNTFFICVIIYILVTKLRASNTAETTQTRKAVKAAVVLLPLLGIPFMLFVVQPPGAVGDVFKYITATFDSLQGLFVAVLYCFLNGEVKMILKKRLSDALQNSRTSTMMPFTFKSYGGNSTRSSHVTAVNSPSHNGRFQKLYTLQEIEQADSDLDTGGVKGQDTEASQCMIENVV